ncbi:MAG: AAA family ATPase [Rhodospirillales bacterium]|nr:AAA family ATPase [Rhodospirillales bacterium]
MAHDNKTDKPSAPAPSGSGRACVIVFGNEKGGSGKSTSAMHVAIALLRLGYRVGTMDLDARQATLTRYMKNRFDFIVRTRGEIPMPEHLAIEKSEASTVERQQEEDRTFFHLALAEMCMVCDFIIVDTPGADGFLSRLAHSHADILVTPMNDSHIDLDLLGDVDPETHAVRGPSVYTKMVAEQRALRAARDGGTIDWIVTRNRLGHVISRSRRDIGALLEDMAARFDFRLAPGFGERVIFRDLFLKGLTLLDLREDKDNPLTLSQIAARQEVRQLVRAIAPEKIRGHRRPAAVC